MKSGLLFSRFFKALTGTIDFHATGIKLSLKITNRIVEKLSSALLLSLNRFCFCKHIILMFLKECFFFLNEFSGLVTASKGLLFPGTC